MNLDSGVLARRAGESGKRPQTRHRGRAASVYIAELVVMIGLAALIGRAALSIQVLDYLVLAAVFGVAVIGYDLLVGIAGQFALGNSGLVLVGAYTTGYASLHWQLSPILEAALAIGTAVLVALVVGVITLRLRDLYFGVATLIFGTLMVSIAKAWTSVTGGDTGLAGIEPIGGGTVVSVSYRFWMPFAWAIVAVALVVCQLLKRSSLGEGWSAVSRDETLAASLGINCFRSKLSAFIWSGAFAGISGFLYAHYIQYLTPDDFGPTLAISMLLMVYLGGAGTVWGALVGALVVRGLIVGLPSDNNWSFAAYALILLAVFALLPRGVAGIAGDTLRRLRRV